MINTSSKQDFVTRFFKYNLREKLLAVFCTLLIMFVAVCLKPVNKVYSVKVYTKTAPDQVIVSGSIDHVEVKVNGNFFALRKIESEDLVMNFDLSNESAGEITVNIGDNELPAVFEPLDVKNISPRVIILTTEEKKTETAPAEPAPIDETAKEAADQEPVEGTVKENKEPAPVQTFHETSPQPERPANEEKNE